MKQQLLSLLKSPKYFLHITKSDKILISDHQNTYVTHLVCVLCQFTISLSLLYYIYVMLRYIAKSDVPRSWGLFIQYYIFLQYKAFNAL